MNPTPAFFIAVTCAERGAANGSDLSTNTTFAVGYFSNEALMPSAQSVDSAETPYAMMPTLVTPSCLATHGRTWPAHLKHSAPLSANMLFLPANSGLMFQMNVGWLARASALAPPNNTDAPKVAKALSFARLACTTCALEPSWSSCTATSFSCRP